LVEEVAEEEGMVALEPEVMERPLVWTGSLDLKPLLSSSAAFEDDEALGKDEVAETIDVLACVDEVEGGAMDEEDALDVGGAVFDSVSPS
jgi:hypothetical protein